MHEAAFRPQLDEAEKALKEAVRALASAKKVFRDLSAIHEQKRRALIRELNALPVEERPAHSAVRYIKVIEIEYDKEAALAAVTAAKLFQFIRVKPNELVVAAFKTALRGGLELQGFEHERRATTRVEISRDLRSSEVETP